MKLMTPSNKRGWYWTEGITLVNNPDRNTGLANEFINTCLTTEGQYSICWDDATSKGAPINTDAFSEFSEDEQQTIMMYEDNGFDSSGELLDSLVQYKISPQQEQWLDMWSRAKATAGIYVFSIPLLANQITDSNERQKIMQRICSISLFSRQASTCRLDCVFSDKNLFDICGKCY